MKEQPLIFETHALGHPINDFIESIFYYKHFMPQHSIERVVPSGHVFIIFELDGMLRHTFDNQTLKSNASYTKVWVSGMHKKFLSISAHPDSEMFVIQIKPFGAYPFFQVPINGLNDKVIPGAEIFGTEILKLRTQILEAGAVQDKFILAENWLKKKFNAALAPEEELMAVAKKMFAHPLSEHQSIVDVYPKTQKHLITQFKKFGGLTPKVFHRIMRFNDILQQIKDQQEISWSRVAYLSGYADQSHFIKEFKEFSGFNPQEFIQQEHHKGASNFFPLQDDK